MKRRFLHALALVPVLALATLAGAMYYAGVLYTERVSVDSDLVLEPGSPGPEPGPIGDFAFAVVSDLHFGQEKDEEAVTLLSGIPGLEGAPIDGSRRVGRPRFVVTCGDNIDNGEGADAAAEYARFKRAIASVGLPYYYANGNHDVYGAKDSTRGLRAEPFAGGQPYYRFEFEGVHFVVLNFYTDLDGDNPPAELDDEQKAWFRESLLAIGPRRPIVLVFHPLPERWEWVRMPPWIAMRRESATFLASTIARFNVVAMLCGHYHVHHVEEWQGVPVICIGSWSTHYPYVVIGQVEGPTMTFVAFREGKWDSGRVLAERPVLAPGR